MTYFLDDPQRPSLVIRDEEAFLQGLADATAAMNAAVAETERREAWFPVLRLVRECRIMNRRTRGMFYERRRDAAMRERIERRLQQEREGGRQ